MNNLTEGDYVLMKIGKHCQLQAGETCEAGVFSGQEAIGCTVSMYFFLSEGRSFLLKHGGARMRDKYRFYALGSWRSIDFSFLLSGVNDKNI